MYASDKEMLDKVISEMDSKVEVYYYGIFHLRLVQNREIVGVLSFNQNLSLSDIKEYLESNGFKVVGEIDASQVKPLDNGTHRIFGIKNKWW